MKIVNKRHRASSLLCLLLSMAFRDNGPCFCCPVKTVKWCLIFIPNLFSQLYVSIFSCMPYLYSKHILKWMHNSSHLPETSSSCAMCWWIAGLLPNGADKSHRRHPELVPPIHFQWLHPGHLFPFLLPSHCYSFRASFLLS